MRHTYLRITLGTVAVLLCFSALVGCAKKQEPVPPTPTAPTVKGPGAKAPGGEAPAKKFRIFFSQANSFDPWRKVMDSDADAEVGKHKDEIDFVRLSASDDPTKQENDLRDMMTKGFDILIISPAEAAPLTKVVEEVFDKGIPVILLDRKVESDKYTCYIGSDNVKIGEEAGRFAVKELAGKGKYCELQGVLGASATIERQKGFHNVVDKEAGMKIRAQKSAAYRRDPAVPIVQDWMQAYPDLNLIYCHNDEMALGTVQVLKKVGKIGKLMVIGVDACQKEAIEAVKNGDMTATLVYPGLGKESIVYALKILKKEKFEKEHLLPTKLITRDNAEEYIRTTTLSE